MNNTQKHLFAILLVASTYSTASAQSCAEFFKQIFCCCASRQASSSSGLETAESWSTETDASPRTTLSSGLVYLEDNLQISQTVSLPASPVTGWPQPSSNHDFSRPAPKKHRSRIESGMVERVSADDFDMLPDYDPSSQAPAGSGKKVLYWWPF